MKLDKSEGKHIQQKVETEAIEEKPIITNEKTQETPEPKSIEPATLETPVPADTDTTAEKAEQSAPKKRGRKPKSKKNEQPSTEKDSEAECLHIS